MTITMESVTRGRTKNHLVFKGYVPSLNPNYLYSFDYTGTELSTTAASMTDDQQKLLLRELKRDFGYAPFKIAKAKATLGTHKQYFIGEI